MYFLGKIFSGGESAVYFLGKSLCGGAFFREVLWGEEAAERFLARKLQSACAPEGPVGRFFWGEEAAEGPEARVLAGDGLGNAFLGLVGIGFGLGDGLVVVSVLFVISSSKEACWGDRGNPLATRVSPTKPRSGPLPCRLGAPVAGAMTERSCVAPRPERDLSRWGRCG